ncbi:MAG: hypothetical protein IT305_17095 [Chloroflexi bacterium]|nr:hypothetical protein [Chloroflexota bacterium]
MTDLRTGGHSSLLPPVRTNVRAGEGRGKQEVEALAVFKSAVQVRDTLARPIGAGMAYVHLRLGTDAEQQATGTVSLRAWEPADQPPAHLVLADGRLLAIEVSRSVLSDCSTNHILRFQASWPPAAAPTSSSPER